MTTDLSQFRSKALVLAVIAALLAWSLGLPNWIHTADAAALIDVTDTISDSDLGATATHTIQFELSSAINAGETIVITFDPVDGDLDFDFGSLSTSDVTVASVPGGGITQIANDLACNNGVTNQMYVSDVDNVTDTVELTVCPSDTPPDEIATGTVVQIVVGGNGNYIANPNVADSYVIEVAGTMADSGDTRVAVIDDVTVTAEVETILTFTIAGVASGTTVNDEPLATYASTTATSVAFGILQTNQPRFLAQELRIDTNALNGFTVTVEADQTLTAGNTATIDPFNNGSEVPVGTPWANPLNNFGVPNTYGHWGLTSDDDDVGTALDFGGVGTSSYVGNFVNNPVEVFYNSEAVSYTSAPVSGESFTRVGYKIEIGTLQEAADDYTATLTYVATPVF